jgi:hypothetical protein
MKSLMTQKRIFGPERDALTGGWRILHSKEFRNLSRQIIRRSN